MRFIRPPRVWVALVAVAAAVAGIVLAIAAGGSSPAGRPAAAGRPSHGSHPGARRVRPAPGSGPHRNVVFVLTDDLSTDLMQYMPHVRALAARGTSFSNYFVVDSLCCPSRAAILTGQYPHDTGVFYNAGANGGWDKFQRVGDGRKVYGLSLQAAGYRTGFMGKYLNHYPPRAHPPAGWDEWDVTGSQGYHEFDYDLNVNGRVHHFGHHRADYLTDVMTNRAARFISDAGKRPFALELATYAPHQPAVPAPADRGSFAGLRAPRGAEWNRVPTDAPPWLQHYPALSRFDVAGIDALYRRRVESVQAVDRMVGQVEADLVRTGELQNTYFLFSSDNGFHMGQRRMMPGKQTPYDTDIRVPLVVAGPGVPVGRTSNALVSSIDLAPTFEQIAGAHATFAHDGVSMLGLWHGDPVPAGWGRSVLVEHRAANIPGDPDRQGTRSGIGPSYEAVRTHDYLYVEYVTGDREYYDLRTDPNEMVNVVTHLSPARLAALHAYLQGLANCHGADCRTRTLAVA